jgi:hypothetical protein
MERVFLALSVAMLTASMQSFAQATSGSSVLSGRVTQAGDTTIAVGGADIEIVGTALRGYANGEGRFRFADMLAGTYELRVRRLGYEPATLRVVLQDGRWYEQRVELRRHPHALTEVQINGQMLRVPARFEDVYARAAHEHGTFFTREDIDKLNPNDVQSLLNLVPTVYVNDRGVTFQRCNAGFQGLIISPFARANQVQAGRAGPEAQTVVQVYIDGTRVTMNKNTSVLDALGLVHPRDIEAMEVYTGVARIPAEFLNDACAVIAIWTKSH